MAQRLSQMDARLFWPIAALCCLGGFHTSRILVRIVALEIRYRRHRLGGLSSN